MAVSFFIRWQSELMILGLFALVTAAGGCQVRPSTEWRPTSTDPPHEKGTLTRAEQNDIRRALASIAYGHAPSPDREPRPIDWRDIRRVVDAACSEMFMAVAQVENVDDATRVYRIRTIDEKPAELIVSRDGKGLADFSANATVGLFEDCQDRARELVEHFESHLIQLRQRRLAEIGQ
jgi:hypothetical protein